MIILKIIGVLLKIIGVILLILLAAMCVPVHLGVQYDASVTVKLRYLFIKYTFDGGQDGEAEKSDESEKPPGWLKTLLMTVAGFFVGIFEAVKGLFLTVGRLFQRGFAFLRKKWGKKPQKKKSRGEGAKPKKDKPKQSLFGSLREERGFWGAVGFFVDIGKALGGAMVRIYRGVAVDRFTLRLAVAGEDAADTAIKYGEVCSAAFPALSFLLTNARRYRQDIEITPNFHNDGNQLAFDGAFTVYPILVLAHLLGAVVRFLVLQIKITLRSKKTKRKAE